MLWLLNHTTARKFEIPMLKSLGFEEIFLPKKIPSDVGFRSASIDFSEDENLSIPPSDLAALNAADWYAGPPADVWSIANRHFDIAFFILHHVDLLSSLAKHFSGAAIWRAYGIVGSTSYSRNLQFAWNGSAWKDIRKLGSRFWFGEAYDQLGDIERRDLRSRRVHLPLGLAPEGPPPVWTGTTKKLFFVCPRSGPILTMRRSIKSSEPSFPNSTTSSAARNRWRSATRRCWASSRPRSIAETCRDFG